MGLDRKVSLAQLPVASTALTQEPRLYFPGGGAELTFGYRANRGDVTGGLRFERVRSLRFRAEGHSTSWHVEQAYDTLVEVQDSTWVLELVTAEANQPPWPWEIRHFLIYIDSAGAYEFAAESWSWIEEAPVE